MVPECPEGNGEKKMLWKFLTVLLTVILGLGTTIWATQSGKINRNCLKTEVGEKFRAAQVEKNNAFDQRFMNMEKWLERIEKKQDKILDELRSK